LLSAFLIPRAGPPQRAFACRQRRRRAPQLRQNPIDVKQAGRLHHPGDHQVTEDLVIDRIKAQASIDPGQGVVEQAVAALEYPRPRHQLPHWQYTGTIGEQFLSRRWNHLCPNGFRGDTQIQLALGVIGQQLPGVLDEQTQLGLITRRAHMANDPAAAIDGLSDLDRSRARGGAHSPDPDHPASLLTQISA
jgi:hypothetical protein